MILENQEILLRPPTPKDKDSVWSYRQEFIDHNENISGGGGLLKINTYDEWLQKLANSSSPKTLPEGKVPVTQFLTIRKKDNKLVGVVNVRHYLNDVLLKHGGHIGDSVRPSERKKGYGTMQIGLAIKYLKSIGTNKILITCNKDNEASRKTIINNGGQLENEIIQDNETIQRYWIN